MTPKYLIIAKGYHSFAGQSNIQEVASSVEELYEYIRKCLTFEVYSLTAYPDSTTWKGLSEDYFNQKAEEAEKLELERLKAKYDNA